MYTNHVVCPAIFAEASNILPRLENFEYHFILFSIYLTLTIILHF